MTNHSFCILTAHGGDLASLLLLSLYLCLSDGGRWLSSFSRFLTHFLVWSFLVVLVKMGGKGVNGRLETVRGKTKDSVRIGIGIGIARPS